VKVPLIVIGAGGTAGHVVPALAVADALRAEGAEVVFAGGQRAEQELVPAAGYELHTLHVQPLARRSPARAARAAVVDAGAVRDARRLVRSLKPAAALGAGGYVAGPVGLAAVLSHVPLVLMESDSHLGLTNRLLAPLARAVCLAFPIPGRDGARYRLTGRPVPPPATDRAAARARFGIGPEETCVLVFGGSQGARSINHAALEASPARPSTFCTRPAPGTSRTSVRPGPTMTCGATYRTSARRSWPVTWWWRARADRYSRSPRTVARWC
jgi:UDP-N-acetylglucosamine--N-acetylmuramyl-(pentapeptide) pyrophosphoryl-undecaprenol N-acetylglucosamine transferase